LVRGADQPQHNDRHREGGQIDVEGRAEPEVEKEKEDEERNPSKKPDINGDRTAERRMTVYLTDGQRHSEDQSQSHGPDDDDQGHERTLEKVRQRISYGDQTFRHPFTVAHKNGRPHGPRPSRLSAREQASLRSDEGGICVVGQSSALRP